MSQAQALSVEQRLDQLEARAAIRELLADYAYGCDNHDAPRFLSAFADDATYDLGEVFGAAQGTEAIASTLETIWKASPETRHWITDVTVDFDGDDRATGDAHTICYVKNDKDEQLFVACDYDNVYERRDGVWKMARCVLTVHWWKKVDMEDLA